MDDAEDIRHDIAVLTAMIDVLRERHGDHDLTLHACTRMLRDREQQLGRLERPHLREV